MQQRGTPQARELAKDLRKRLTPTERRVWALVRNRRLLGLKFRRQHAIHRFVVDFYCPALKLILEVEGDIHDSPARVAADRERAAILEGWGFRVIRMRNKDASAEWLVRTITPMVEGGSKPAALNLG